MRNNYNCAIIIRSGGGGGGAEKLELSSINLDSTPPPKQKKLVLTPLCYDQIFCLYLVRCLIVTLRCAVNVTTSSFQQFP